LLEEPYPTSAFSRTRATWFTNNIVHNYSNVMCSVNAEEIMPWLTLPWRLSSVWKFVIMKCKLVSNRF